MAVSETIRRARRNRPRRHDYHRLICGIERLSDCDLNDMGTTRNDMRRAAWRSICG